MKKVWTWQLWDWRSILTAIFVIVGICVSFYLFDLFPNFMRKTRSSNMTAITSGQYISSTDITERHQGRTGTSTKVVGASVKYSYFVNKVCYYNTDNVPFGHSTNSFFEKLNNIKDLTLKIKYNSKNPIESQIDTNN